MGRNNGDFSSPVGSDGVDRTEDFCAIEVDRQGCIVDCDKSASSILGYSIEDVRGRPIAEVFFPEERRVAIRGELQGYLQIEQSDDTLPRRLEFLARRSDGSRVPIELTLDRRHQHEVSGTFRITIREIGDPIAVEAVLRERAELASLHASLALALGSDAELNAILSICCRHLVDGLNASLARIWLFDEDVQRLVLAADSDSDALADSTGVADAGEVADAGGFAGARGVQLAIGEGLVGRIAQTCQPILANDQNKFVSMLSPMEANEGQSGTLLGYPLVVASHLVGVVTLAGRDPFSLELFEQLQPMADAIAQCVLRKKTEQGLLERERRLDLALDAGRLGIWEWDVRSDRVIWSKQLYALFGYDETLFVPSRAGFMDIVHAEDKAYLNYALDDLVNGDTEVLEMEFRVVRGDNQRIVWTSGRGILQRDEHGRPLSVIAAVSDVTERKQWELELADREAQLRRVINNTLFFIGILSPDGVLLEANSSALSAAGIAREDVVGKKFWDTYWWNFDTLSQERLKDALNRAAAGETIRYDVVVRMSGDSRTTIDFMVSPIRDECGNITHLIPSGVDVQDRKTTEQQLADAKLRLDLAMEASNVAAWSWSAESDQPVSNPNLNRMFGFDADAEPDFGEFLSRMHEEDRDRVASAIRHSMDTGEAYEEEYRVVLPSGQTRWFHARGSSRLTDDGRFDEFLGVLSDVTEQKLYELELSNREAHLRRVINNQLGLVGVIDRSGNLLEVDDDSLRIAGLTRADVIGKHFADCAWWSYDPALSQKMRESMERAFTGETVRFDTQLYAAGLGRPDNPVVIDFMLAPLRDEDGNIEYLIPSGVDISDRVAADEARRDNEERLKMALRAGGMAAWEWNVNESVWTNEVYELLGIDPDQPASPELFFQFVHPDDQQGLRDAWDRSIRGESEYDHEFRIIRPDGEVRWVVGVGEYVRDENGKVIRVFGMNWDSTDEHLAAETLKRSEQKAQMANKAKTEFVANMSHEIRTPLTAVLGYTELLIGQETDSDKLDQLKTIQRNGTFLLGIINDILDLSKIEAGKLDITKERFSVIKVIEDVRSMMDVRATERNLAFDVKADGFIPEAIESDPKRLRQILINLVGNAIKFTESGSVVLTIREVQRQGKPAIEFEVADTGIGMTESQQSRLFRPFSQGDASVTRAYGGTGLGLAISQRLAGMLGGEISFESQVGVGSRFTVVIAAGDVEGEQRVRPTLDYTEEILDQVALSVPLPSGLDCVVLVVDDRRDVRFLSRRILTNAGGRVHEAVDGQEAIDKICNDPEFASALDLVLLDMQMPRLDGYQTATKLRQIGFEKPIVALTADAMQDDMNRCIAAGCDEFLSKPIDSRKLVELVDRLTSKPRS